MHFERRTVAKVLSTRVDKRKLVSKFYFFFELLSFWRFGRNEKINPKPSFWGIEKRRKGIFSCVLKHELCLKSFTWNMIEVNVKQKAWITWMRLLSTAVHQPPSPSLLYSFIFVLSISCSFFFFWLFDRSEVSTEY